MKFPFCSLPPPNLDHARVSVSCARRSRVGRPNQIRFGQTFLFGALAFLGSLDCIAAANTDSIPPFAEPSAAILRLAEREHISITGFSAPRGTPTSLPGDTVTILFTQTVDGVQQQLLAELTVVPAEEADQKRQSHDFSIYSTAGNEFHLSRTMTPLRIRMYAPPSGDAEQGMSKPADKIETRLVIANDFLACGFDTMAKIAIRIREKGFYPSMGFKTAPPSASELEFSKSWAAKAGFTREDEEQFAKQSFAVVEFLDIANKTPGLKDLAQSIIGRPSILSGLLSLDFGIFFAYEWDRVAPVQVIPNREVYLLPFTLHMYHKDVTSGEWYITSPLPPLLTTAGVIALRVRSLKYNNRSLEMRVLSAQGASISQ